LKKKDLMTEEEIVLKCCRILRNEHLQYGFNVKSDVINGFYLPFISSIEENSPAELGGVEKGDFIVSINGIRTCGLRNKTIVTLVKRYPLHALFLCCKSDKISRVDPFDVTKYRTWNHWESWSKFGVPRNYYFKGIDLIQLVDNIDYEMRFKANFGEEISEGDRLVLINGRKIKSKEKVIERLAHDKSVTLTVMDQTTEKVFQDLDLDITEDFIANLSIPNHSNLENLKKKFERVPERTKKSDEEKKLGEIMKEEQFVKTVNKASIEIQKKYNRKIDTFKNQLDSLRKEKKEMRSRYEYETGKLIGMNQAYVKQNGEMRKRIEAQNKRIEEFQKRESQSKIILRELEQSLERATTGKSWSPAEPIIIEPVSQPAAPPALPPRPSPDHLTVNSFTDTTVLSDIDESEVM